MNEIEELIKSGNAKETACPGRLRHRWTDGWICDYCGKRRADIEKFKYNLKKKAERRRIVMREVKYG
jgi:hypothetical protein